MAAAPVVQLTWSEFSIAAHVGAMRQVESVRNGNTNMAPGSTDEAEAAAAEMAVAKALGVYWDGSVNNFTEPDVAGLHVRYTSRSSGSLIVRPRDLDKFGSDAKYVLVTGGRGEYRIAGEITAGEAAQAKWSKNPSGRGAAYFVPQSELKPFGG